MINLSVFETKAVIIKTQDYRENDKLVWFYTENLGKITAIVRGAKKSKSRFLSLTLPLCYGEYMVYKSKEDVIKALRTCINVSSCELCPYKDFDYAVEEIHCSDQVMMDAAEYLSEE